MSTESYSLLEEEETDWEKRNFKNTVALQSCAFCCFFIFFVFYLGFSYAVWDTCCGSLLLTSGFMFFVRKEFMHCTNSGKQSSTGAGIVTPASVKCFRKRGI